MSSSKRLIRLAFVGVTLVGAAALGACTFTPVYSETSAAKADMQLAYAKPTSRVEQIIYQDLALRLGSSDSPTAPLVAVSASALVRSLAISVTANPAKPYDLTVNATLTVTKRDGSMTKPITLTRRATASYTTTGQVEADVAAANYAAEQAAHATAESLRLAMLAVVTR